MFHARHRFWKCYKTLTFCSLWTRCTIPCACHAKRHLNLQKWREYVVLCAFSPRNVLRATKACTFSTSQLPKVVRAWCVCTFWLRNVLRATTACTFSTSQLPKVVRHWGVLYILTSICASRHKGVHFFISHLASWLRTRRFSEPTFRPSGASNHWKNTSVSRLSYLFAHLHLLSSDSFSSTLLSSNLFSLPLPCSAFHLSILSEVWLLNFLRKAKQCRTGTAQVVAEVHDREDWARATSTRLRHHMQYPHHSTTISLILRAGDWLQTKLCME